MEIAKRVGIREWSTRKYELFDLDTGETLTKIPERLNISTSDIAGRFDSDGHYPAGIRITEEVAIRAGLEVPLPDEYADDGPDEGIGERTSCGKEIGGDGMCGDCVCRRRRMKTCGDRATSDRGDLRSFGAGEVEWVSGGFA